MILILSSSFRLPISLSNIEVGGADSFDANAFRIGTGNTSPSVDRHQTFPTEAQRAMAHIFAVHEYTYSVI